MPDNKNTINLIIPKEMQDIGRMLPYYANFVRGDFDSLFCELYAIYEIFETQIPVVKSFKTSLDHIDIINLLETGLQTIMYGRTPIYANLVLDFEVARILKCNSNLSDKNIMEIFIIKEFISLVREREFDEFAILISEFCSNEFRCNINEKLNKIIC